ncbi:MAG TPA: aminoglycoside phosphotransferase family protein [Gemmatimonadaceae bacterium]|nr:aminoglycoside phosphotransferase family protein [Gemmatimonadaceae bacterium]
MSLPAGVHVLCRDFNEYSTSLPTEVATCQFGDAEPVRLFCKHYHAEGGQARVGSVVPHYEIDVYRSLLASAPVSLPQFRGSWSDDESGDGLLVLGNIENAVRVTKGSDHKYDMERAASWAGRFHRFAEGQVSRPALAFMRHVDLDDTMTRSLQLVEWTAKMADEKKFFERLVSGFDQIRSIVSSSPLTVIHGDYYPQNILVSEGVTYPVDWETASIGFGEIDLAMLLEGYWAEDIIERCVAAYISARGGAAEDVRKRLAAAQIISNVYWISLYPESELLAEDTTEPPWRFDLLQTAASSLLP